jgi:hypothetical protein
VIEPADLKKIPLNQGIPEIIIGRSGKTMERKALQNMGKPEI